LAGIGKLPEPIARSGSAAEDLVDDGALARHIVARNAVHLPLGQHRHYLHQAGQRAPRRPEAPETEHRPRSALGAAVLLLDRVAQQPAAAPVPREVPQLASFNSRIAPG
jgi:hypothetical protein